jgi:phosphoserine phosphatase
MSPENEDSQRYTGLVLLSGEDAPGIASKLFSALEPFSLRILDIEQLVIRNRLILTVLIELDPAHAEAIEDDLNQCAIDLDVDIATSFGTSSMRSIDGKDGIIKVDISADKFTPGLMADFMTKIFNIGANLEKIHRVANIPRLTFEFYVSGTDSSSLENMLKISQQKFSFDFNLN